MSASKSPKPRRWKCVCAYDGTHYDGWQSQLGGKAVQDVIEERLAQIFKEPVRIYGSGRTDAGVHAHAQVFHFDAAWAHAPARLLAALRSELPETIQIKTVRKAAANFHSRFKATGKRYVYNIYLGDADPFTRPWSCVIPHSLNFKAMEAVAAELRGTHDFRALSAINGTEREDTVRELRRLDIIRSGKRIRIVAESAGFLYKMVRSLVGALIAAGEGRITAEEMKAILLSGQRVPAIKTAPPQGLFLDKVFY